MSESRKGGGDKNGELDDWASAIDEWDANLALPSPTATPQKTEAAPVAEEPKQRERSATPAVGVPELRRRDGSAPLDVPAPLDAAPLPEPGPEEDPLMHLFDGEM